MIPIPVDLTDIVPSQEAAYELFPPTIIGPTWAKDANGKWELPEHTLGWEALGWIAEWLLLPNGEPWVATPEQARFILWYYAIDEDGWFIYDNGFLQRMKGWGKDPIAAAISIFELCGPCRFDHWDEDGNPVGKTIPDALVWVTAVSMTQNSNTSDLYEGMIPKRTRVEFQMEVMKEVIYARNNTQRLRVVAANYRSGEGGRVTFAIGNECHHWVPGNGGPKFYVTLGNNLAKGQGRLLFITNAYQPGEESVAQSIRDEQEEVWAGTREDSGWLYDSLEGHPDSPLTSDWAPFVVKMISGDAHWLTDGRGTRTIVRKINDGSVAASSKRRMWYNQIVSTEEQLFAVGEWDGAKAPGLTGTKRDLEPGDEITMGFDGSKTDDATALVAIRIRDKLIVPLAIWQNPEPAEKWHVPVHEVVSEVNMAFATYKVRAFFADVNEWGSYVNEWSDEHRETLLIKATPQSACGFDMRGHKAEIATGNEALMGAIIDRTVHHNGDKLLRVHAGNAHTFHNGFGVVPRKESAESQRKIDAYVATLLAYMAMVKLAESGKKPEREYTRRLYQQ